MKNHSHSHPHHEHPQRPEIEPFDPAHPERYAAAKKSTWISVVINLVLTVLQLVVGYFGRSQALMADGLHSLSDLLSDFLVLFANRQSNRHADARHPYGHARIETASTLFLGAVLAVLGVSLLVGAGLRLQEPENLQTVHPATLWVALLTLLAKEGLYHYLMAVAKRVRSQMLAANAWHSRSDAASSLVVLVGIAGNLMGFVFLDLVAAAVVGVMIARMGGKLAMGALSELIDTGLDAKEVRAIRDTLRNTPGVCSLHELRTRKMADNALVDAHIVVDPRISVSEGHYIAEAARQAVLAHHHVLDVMVHIDPEDDVKSKPNADLPDRAGLLAHLSAGLGDPLIGQRRVVFHYLDGMVDAEVFFPEEDLSCERAEALRAQCGRLVRDDQLFRSVQVHRSGAPE